LKFVWSFLSRLLFLLKKIFFVFNDLHFMLHIEKHVIVDGAIDVTFAVVFV
jgi:hypothetical protein